MNVSFKMPLVPAAPAAVRESVLLPEAAQEPSEVFSSCKYSES